jgi:hypothetical protein
LNQNEKDRHPIIKYLTYLLLALALGLPIGLLAECAIRHIAPKTAIADLPPHH